MLPTVDSLQERYKAACDLKQQVDYERITTALTAWGQGITDSPFTVRFPTSKEDTKRVFSDTREASDAYAEATVLDPGPAMRAGGAAFWEKCVSWAVRDASDSWFVRVARSARSAKEARIASDASPLGATSLTTYYWAGLNNWSAWDITHDAAVAIGAAELNDLKTYQVWIHLLEAFEAGAWILMLTRTELFVISIPTVSTEFVDNRARLHNATGPACSFLDVRDYYWHGVRVPAAIIEHPETITAAQIKAETDLKVQRAMIERYGQERYLADSD